MLQRIAGIFLKKAPVNGIGKAMFGGLKTDSGDGPAQLQYQQTLLLVSGMYLSFTKGIRPLELELAG